MKIGGLQISNRWFAQFGMIGNAIAKRYKDMTPEQKENQEQFWHTFLGLMEVDALNELENGIFANSSSLLQAISDGNPDRYLMNTVNLMANIVQTSAFAQHSRAALDQVPSSKADTFLEKLNQNFAQRSSLYRTIFNTNINYKRDIWGKKIEKGGTEASRMLGVSKANPDLFGRPIYQDFIRTTDSGFLPPAVLPILNDKKLTNTQHDRLQEYIGESRENLVKPYINDAAKIEGFNVKYSQLNDEDKKYVLQALYSWGRQKGVDRFYIEYPEFKPAEKPIFDPNTIPRDIFMTLKGIEVKYPKPEKNDQE